MSVLLPVSGMAKFHPPSSDHHGFTAPPSSPGTDHRSSSGSARRVASNGLPATESWRFLSLVAAIVTGLTFASTAGFGVAQEEDELENRPSANRILPEETVLYLRVRSFPDLLDYMQDSSMGQMLGDERVAPLVDDLYNNVKREYDERVKEELDGMELEQFRDLFAGELCFAVVAKRRKDPEAIMICDVDPESETANQILGLAKTNLEDDGKEITTEEEGEIEIEILPGGDRDIHYFRIENTVYLSTNRDLCAEMIANINGEPLEKTRPFIDNRKYRTIMGHCRVDKDHPPILTFFVDPIELFKTATRGEPVSQMAVGVLPVLGLDGLSAIGGATLPGDDEFQAFSHLHIMMASPRKGILEAVSFKAGSYDPSAIIPNDVAVMMTTRLDIPRLYNGIKTINDTFRGEDSLENDLERASEEIGISIKEEIIDAFTGNLTLVTWPNPESSEFNGVTNGYLLGLNDEETARETMEKLLDRIREEDEDAIAEKSYNGIDYYYVDGIRTAMERQQERRRERWEELDDEDRERREREAEITSGFARAPVPAFAVFDNQVVIADSIEFMEKFIDTYKGKNPALTDAEDYQKIRDIAKKYLDGQQPSGIMFSRPMAQLGPIWRALKGDNVKDFLEMGAEDDGEMSDFAGSMLESMKKNELPELSELEQYFTTSGGFMTDDASGIHFFIFETRPQGKKKKK